MLEMIWKPTLYGFDTCKEFAEAFRLNSDDLILSNAYIYEPYFGCMENLNCHVIFQEKYGAGGAHRRDGGCDPGRRGQDQL